MPILNRSINLIEIFEIWGFVVSSKVSFMQKIKKIRLIDSGPSILLRTHTHTQHKDLITTRNFLSGGKNKLHNCIQYKWILWIHPCLCRRIRRNTFLVTVLQIAIFIKIFQNLGVGPFGWDLATDSPDSQRVKCSNFDQFIITSVGLENFFKKTFGKF